MEKSSLINIETTVKHEGQLYHQFVLVPSKKFKISVKFDPSQRKYELAQRGFCQLILTCFKHMYGLIQKDMKLPLLTPEPELIIYDDNTYALNWWPHYIYRLDTDELVNHEFHALDVGVEFHKRYVEGELNQKRLFEQKLNDLFQQASNIKVQPQENLQALTKENSRLTEQIEAILVQLRVAEEDNEKKNTKMRKLEKDLVESERNLETALKQLDKKSQNSDNLFQKQEKVLYPVQKQEKAFAFAPNQESVFTNVQKQEKVFYPVQKQEKAFAFAPNQESVFTNVQKQDKVFYPLRKQEEELDHVQKQEKAFHKLEHS